MPAPRAEGGGGPPARQAAAAAARGGRAERPRQLSRQGPRPGERRLRERRGCGVRERTQPGGGGRAAAAVALEASPRLRPLSAPPGPAPGSAPS